MGLPFGGLANKKDQLSKLMKLRSQKKKIAQQRIRLEEDGVVVVISGDFKIKKLIVDGREDKRLLDALNKGMRKAQKAVAKENEALLGDLLGM